MSSTPSAPDPHIPPPATRAEAARTGYDAPAAAYGAPPAPYADKPTRSRTLGIVAFIIALAGTVIGSILATLGGVQTGRLAQYRELSSGTNEIDPSTLPPEVGQIGAAAGLLLIGAFVVWGILGLWGLVQGIVAAVKNRGRGWGIAAIVLAVVGGGIVFVFMGIGVAIGAAPYV